MILLEFGKLVNVSSEIPIAVTLVIACIVLFAWDANREVHNLGNEFLWSRFWCIFARDLGLLAAAIFVAFAYLYLYFL